MTGGATLLLTRPEAQSKAFLKDCEIVLGRNVPCVISPIFDIVPVGSVPDLSNSGTIIVTSGHAVRRLSNSIQGRSVVTVGAATADLARSFGAEAVAFGETAQDILDRGRELVPPVLVCRGVHARLELADELSGRGVDANEAVIYDQFAKPMTKRAVDLLAGVDPVIVPVFSPRSAALLAEYETRAPITVVAISDAAKSAWIGRGKVQVANHPTAQSMCDAVTAIL